MVVKTTLGNTAQEPHLFYTDTKKLMLIRTIVIELYTIKIWLLQYKQLNLKNKCDVLPHRVERKLIILFSDEPTNCRY